MEKLQLPNKVVKADWKDDIDLDFETYGDPKEEADYISPDQVSKESIDRIKARKLNQERGNKFLSAFTKSEKLLA